MGSSRAEAGYTLVEVLVVIGMMAVVIATLGAFFLGGPSPAVASAARDIDAAFSEARETAAAFSEATIVFLPAGSGYTARVYRDMPGDAQFAAVNGPTYDSTVALSETAAPLGAPGFAFRIDRRGSVTGYQHFSPDSGTFTERSCPTGGQFVLALAYAKQTRNVIVPCVLSVSAALPLAVAVTPAPAATLSLDVAGTCASAACATSLPAFTATCPPGYTPDGTQPNVCDAPPPAAPTTIPAATPTTSASAVPPITPSPQQATVCDVPGDVNYDSRAGQTIGGIQYVGSTTTPPCAGSLVSPAPSPSATATPSAPPIIALSNFFVGIGSTTIRSTCNGVVATVTNAYAAVAGVYPNSNSQTPQLGDSLTLPVDGASVDLAGTYTYGACNSAGPTTYAFVPFDIESAAFNPSVVSRFMGDVADFCVGYWSGCVARTLGSGVSGEDVPVLSIALLVERMAAQWSSVPSPNYVLYGNATENQYRGGSDGTQLSNLADWILTTIDP